MAMGSDDSVCDELITVLDWIRWISSRFDRASLHFGHGTDNAWDEAIQLVASAAALPWQRLEQVLPARLTNTEKVQLLGLCERRIGERLPLPYLTGEAWFAGLKFAVDRRVLIPRSPIAELIQAEFAPWLLQSPGSILDLCTGSGCIGIACAYAFPDALVDLSDLSEEALAVAQDNVAKHGLSDRVRAVRSDLFEHLPDKYDLIVSNPPYVDEDDMANLPQEFHWEPRLALESGQDGLEFTRRLLREAADHLNPEGVLIVEVGNSAEALQNAFPSVPFTWVDLQQGGDGVFVLTAEQLIDHRRALGQA